MESVPMKNNKRKLSINPESNKKKKTCDTKNILSVFLNKDILRIIAAFSFSCGRSDTRYRLGPADTRYWLPPIWVMDIRKFYRMIHPEHVLECAASQGNLSLVKWFHKNEPKHFSKFVMIAAAAAGCLNTLKWLHANRSEGCDEMALNYAAGNGYFDVVKWLWKNRFEGDIEHSISWARNAGNYEIGDWLHSEGVAWRLL